MRPLPGSAARAVRPNRRARRSEEPSRPPDSAKLPNNGSTWFQVRQRLGISQREVDILRLLFDGCSEKQVADRLSIAEGTVHAHLTRLHLRLQVCNRAQLLVKVFAALTAPSNSPQ